MEETRHNKIRYNKIIFKYDIISPEGVSVWTIYSNPQAIYIEFEYLLEIIYPNWFEIFEDLRKQLINPPIFIHYYYPYDRSGHTIKCNIMGNIWILIRNDVKPIDYSKPKTIGIFGGTGILDENHPDW